MISSTRLLIGLVLVVSAAVAAVCSAFLGWYGGRDGTHIRVQDLFDQISPQTADSLSSVLIPLAVSAVLVLAGIVVWWRWLWALAGGTADRLNRAAESAFTTVVDGAAAWTGQQIVRRVAESMKPYLIDELVPEVIDGVMPKIRADVVPVVIEDLASDDRIRAMIAQQSRGMLTWSVTEVRRASAEADDRVETAARRLLGRRGLRE